MAFKLNKEQRRKLAEFKIEGAARIDKVEAAYDALKTAVEELLDEFNGTVVEAYNQYLEDVAAFADEVASDWQADFDDKSEGWQDGERGQVVAEAISAWEDLTLAPIDPLTVDSLSEGTNAEGSLDELDELPEEVE